LRISWNGPCDLLPSGRSKAAGGATVRGLATAVVLTGAMGLGISLEAHAQALITPTGPLSVKPALKSVLSEDEQIYPGRTMGGGTRILRSNPPPSFLIGGRSDPMVRETQSILNDRVTAVLGFSELLLEESYGSLSSQQKKILFNVVVAAREVRDILRERNEKLVED
jgi:hypothetical protein